MSTLQTIPAQQFAARLGVSPPTITRLIRFHGMPAAREETSRGPRYHIAPAEAAAWILLRPWIIDQAGGNAIARAEQLARTLAGVPAAVAGGGGP